MSIILQGSTSGSVTLQEPAVAGTTILTLPAVSGTVITTGSPQSQSVIQVVTATKSDTASTSSATTADITGMSVSITPRAASSRFYVMASFVVGAPSSHASVVLNRNGTDIGIGNTAGSRARLTASTCSGNPAANQPVSMSLMYVDEPSTTSALTYKIKWRSNDNGVTVYLNRTDVDADNTGYGRFISTITVMEIAG
jgi:hypothetical protein